MNKLVIAGRTNGKNGFYLRLKAQKNAIKVICDIGIEFDPDFLVDDPSIPRALSDYSKWKDVWLPIVDRKRKMQIDIVCGDKIIHLFFRNCKKYEDVNTILDKYTEWAKA